MTTGSSLRPYAVWDRTTRCFHWINALCVFALAALGLAILNEKSFGVSGDGKVLLKTLHVYVGYVFAVNLAWRLIWAFIGTPSARWKGILPGQPGFALALRGYVNGLSRRNAPVYLGHNPLGRLMVTLLLGLMFAQAITGLVLAGTDLYKPPFGAAIAQWVTGGDADKLARLVPGSTDAIDQAAYEQMRSYRKPIVTTHLYVFYVLMFASLLHVASVVITEVREKGGLVSAMLSGQKVLDKCPVDTRPVGRDEDRAL